MRVDMVGLLLSVVPLSSASGHLLWRLSVVPLASTAPAFLSSAIQPVACESDCSGHGHCSGLSCVCELGYIGEKCDVPTCPSHCHGRGSCLVGRCACYDGFVGVDCSQERGSAPPGAVAAAAPGPKRCHGHGDLLPRLGRCVCDHGWAGELCESDICPAHCSGHGSCDRGTCACDPGFHGRSCELRRCPGEPECSLHGVCDAELGSCRCDYGYSGPDCAAASCPGGCSSHGYCLGRRCECVAGWVGKSCAARADGRPLKSAHSPPRTEVRPAAGAATAAGASVHADTNATKHAGCPNGCSGRGLCGPGGRCDCPPGYGGSADCSRPDCPKGCTGHGACADDGTCVCERGWSGTDCSVQGCAPAGCNGRGYCVAGRCICHKCWAGEGCERRNTSSEGCASGPEPPTAARLEAAEKLGTNRTGGVGGGPGSDVGGGGAAGGGAEPPAAPGPAAASGPQPLTWELAWRYAVGGLLLIGIGFFVGIARVLRWNLRPRSK